MLGRFLRSIAHTRPAQLRERLRRILRNRVHDLLPRAKAFRAATPPLASAPPLALFEPRTDRVVLGPDGPRASFLNVEHELATPIDWRAGGGPELERMNLHYMEFLEALDDERFASAVDDWIASNPLEARGSWRIAWNSYVLSLRALVWMQQLAVRRERLDERFVERAHASLAQQLRFLEARLELDIGGNHLVKDAKTLLWASRYFDGDDARRWRQLASELLERELREQVLDDGMHFELSPAYHAQVFADLLECASVAEGTLRAEIVARLEPMAQVLADLTHPDGFPSAFGDGGLHMGYATSECLDVYERVTARPRPTARALIELSSSGYFGVRAESNFCLVDCGALAPDHLPAHGHGDVLAFEWTLEGRRIVVDAGVFEYERGPARARSRSTLVHNTVTLDDRDQAEFWAAFRVGRRPRVELTRFEPLGRGFVLEGRHDGFAHLAGSPIHERRIIAAASSLVVDDTIHGGARQAVRARLLLHPDVEVVPCSREAVTLRCGELAVVVEARHPITVVDAEWCPDFGVRHKTKQLVIHYSPAPSSGGFRMQRTTVSALRGARSLRDFVQRLLPQ